MNTVIACARWCAEICAKSPTAIALAKRAGALLLAANLKNREALTVTFDADAFAAALEPLVGDHARRAEVAATLDLIEQLAPAVVIPGHGSVFTGVADSLAVARQRLDSFVARPERHTRHAAKVLRLRDKGVRNTRSGVRGHQFITLKVVLPNGDEPELAAFLEGWTPRDKANPRKEMLP